MLSWSCRLSYRDRFILWLLVLVDAMLLYFTNPCIKSLKSVHGKEYGLKNSVRVKLSSSWRHGRLWFILRTWFWFQSVNCWLLHRLQVWNILVQRFPSKSTNNLYLNYLACSSHERASSYYWCNHRICWSVLNRGVWEINTNFVLFLVCLLSVNSVRQKLLFYI